MPQNFISKRTPWDLINGLKNKTKFKTHINTQPIEQIESKSIIIPQINKMAN